MTAMPKTLLLLGFGLSAALAQTPPPLPKIVQTDFSTPLRPAYLSNGLIGIRPGSNPLARGRAAVSGFVFAHVPFRIESLSPAPYPLETDIGIGGTRLLDHPELVTIRRQTLDMATAELVTELTFAPRAGLTLDLTVVQFASRSVPSLLCQEVSLTPSAAAEIEVQARIDLSGIPGTVYMRSAPDNSGDLAIGVRGDGELSRLGIAVGLFTGKKWTRNPGPETSDIRFSKSYFVDATPGEMIRVRTIAAMLSQVYHPAPELQAIRMMRWGENVGFDALREQNRQAWRDLWQARIKVYGDNAAQRALDAAFFYLHSSLHRSSFTGMSPYGLSHPTGYYGHSFWDTETWSLLPLILTAPEAAKSLLEYRLRGLEAARRLAALYGYRGAHFPWEGGIDGSEATPTWASTGWTEQHITADVALAFWEYQRATGDPFFLREGTWPVLRAAAEWIESRGVFTPRGFEILNIMGPDEGLNINNSSYMNVAARMVLEAAVKCARMLGYTPPASWTRIAERMVVPIDNKRRIVLPYDNASEKSAYSLGNLDYLTVHDPPLPPDLMRNTYEHERKLRGARAITPGFMCAGVAASAAFFRDRRRATVLFRQSWEPYWVDPYGLTKEHEKGPTCFLTNFGSVLQTVLFGFTGLRISEGDWSRHTATLPEGWARIEVDRIWVRGVPKRLVAEHGKLPRLLDLAAGERHRR
jgi:protein-glucosylgalactosylhydroxylysine glucosidase